MGIRPVLTFDGFDPGVVTRRALERAGERISREADEIGREMVNEVQRIVSSEYQNDSPKPNQTRLVNSFTYKVTRGSGPGGFPFTVSLTIKPGVSKGKVGALNWGVTPTGTNYTIYPRNVPRALEFKNPNPAKAKRSSSTGRFIKQTPKSSAYAGRVLRPYAKRTSTSGPRAGGLFMERARTIVLRRHGYSA